MLEVMRHRGPDGSRWWQGSRRVAMGVTRLAIQGTGDPPGPYFSEAGDVVVVFNGEIYNHAALRQELELAGHRIGGLGDGAILPHLYQEYGIGMVDRLVGMFAIALYDVARDRCYLIRDRLGIKPLYVWSLPGQWRFASELKAFRAFADFPPRLRPEGVAHYLAYRFVPAPETMLFGVEKVLPGWYWQIDRDGEVQRRRWWTLPEPEAKGHRSGAGLGMDEAAEELAALWRTVVRDHLVGERRMGIFLSGGIDSGWIAAEAAPARPKAVILEASAFGPEYDEADEALALAKSLGLAAMLVPLTPPDLDDLSALADMLDEPLGDPTVWSFAQVAAAAREAGLTVMLSGEGADEVFAGYPHYGEALWLSWLERPAAWLAGHPLGRRWLHSGRAGARRLARAIDQANLSYYGVGVTFPNPAEVGLDPVPPPPAVQTAALEWQNRSRLHQMLAFDLQWYLADDALLKCDRVGMAHHLEVRVPYLDHRLVEWAYRLPAPFLRGGRWDKRVLRRAVARSWPALARRPKRGFPTPLGRWLAETLAPTALEVLRDPAVVHLGGFEWRAVEQLAASVRPQGSQAGRKLYALLMLALWWQGLKPTVRPHRVERVPPAPRLP